MIEMMRQVPPNNTVRRRVATRPRVNIVKRWIETADERCPLACVWSALPEVSADQDDESELRWPAFLARLRAGYLQAINNVPAPFKWAGL